MSNYHCPRCGKETEYRAELRGLCTECFVEIKKEAWNKVNLNEVTLRRCRHCKKVFFGNKWVKSTNENLSKIIFSALKGKLKGNASKTSFLKVSIENPNEFKLNFIDKMTGLEIEYGSFPISYKEHVCPECMMKFSGSLYECIIRIRTSKKQLNVINKKINNILRRYIDNIEIIDIKRVKGSGWDIYLAKKNECNHFARVLSEFLKLELSKYVFPRYFKGIKKSIQVTEYILK